MVVIWEVGGRIHVLGGVRLRWQTHSISLKCRSRQTARMDVMTMHLHSLSDGWAGSRRQRLPAYHRFREAPPGCSRTLWLINSSACRDRGSTSFKCRSWRLVSTTRSWRSIMRPTGPGLSRGGFRKSNRGDGEGARRNDWSNFADGLMPALRAGSDL